MFRKITALVVAASLAIVTAGCAGKQIGIPAIDNAIAKVQAAVLKGCSYVVYADTVLAILNAASVETPNTSQVTQWTKQLCDAVKVPAPTGGAATLFLTLPAAPTITVNGKQVPVNGYFM